MTQYKRKEPALPQHATIDLQTIAKQSVVIQTVWASKEEPDIAMCQKQLQ